MKDMIYISPKGKRVVFDDYTNEVEEYGTYWSQICPHCHNKYRGILNRKSSGDGSDTASCGVKGCSNTNAYYYVDFSVGEVAFEEDDMDMNYLQERLKQAKTDNADVVRVDIEEFASLLAAVNSDEKRKLDITKEVVKVEDMDICDDHFIFSYELWFDVDKYFGTNTRDTSDKWICFYTCWSPVNGVTSVCSIESDTGSKWFNWDLTEKEKKFFLERMETYCNETFDDTLYTLWLEESE